MRFFELIAGDNTTGARAGILHTDHGDVETPIFMPVGTQGTVKTISPDEMLENSVQMILANTYHLYLRPGDDLIRKLGGLHQFASWPCPILTDSGGYQVFSMADLRKLDQQGVQFQSHLDGSYHTFTPERVIEIERNLGADVMMVLDECTPYPCSFKYAQESNQLTLKWAERSREHFEKVANPHGYRQFLFGIVQGSTYPEVRLTSVEQLLKLDFDGYAIGGLAVGEPKTAMLEMTKLCAERLPTDKPHYLMGVGKPEDLVDAIALGIDMFDCVIPTRNGRNGTVFAWQGRLVIKNAAYREDPRPIDEGCNCYACRRFSRAYIRHLFQAGEILGPRLATLHNIHFYMELVHQAREAILQNQYEQFMSAFYQRYQSECEETIH